MSDISTRRNFNSRNIIQERNRQDGVDRSHTTTKKHPGVYGQAGAQGRDQGNFEHCLPGALGHEYPALGIYSAERRETQPA